MTADLSFISLLKILPAVRNVIGEGMLVALIKPQFEVGKGQVGKKGVVRDSRLHEDVLIRMIEGAEKMGFRTHGLTRSPIRGQKGNLEFFIQWSIHRTALKPDRLRSKIEEAIGNEKN